jgi:DNA-binding transcriptional ArsR family regulator
MVGKAREFLKALARESRLLILCALAGGEKSVGELEAFLSQRQSKVSQQLARLRLENPVAARRDNLLSPGERESPHDAGGGPPGFLRTIGRRRRLTARRPSLNQSLFTVLSSSIPSILSAAVS